jgi:hypothetical protein
MIHTVDKDFPNFDTVYNRQMTLLKNEIKYTVNNQRRSSHEQSQSNGSR